MSIQSPAKTIEGIRVAHATNALAGTGATVFIAPEGATVGVDVRGGAPASRETNLLIPEETVQEVHAVFLSGGSAFGLEVADGISQVLEQEGIGVNVGVTHVPIVSGSCLFDLAVGETFVRPDKAMGIELAKRALADNTPLASGNVGAGTGASVAKYLAPELAMKAGFGSASIQIGELELSAYVALNALGKIIDPKTGETICAPYDLAEKRFVEASLEDIANVVFVRSNTTLACICTNAKLDKAQATKLAQMAADSYAHCIHPTHTTNDGDTIYTMATGKVEAKLDLLGLMAVEALDAAIIDAAQSASSAYGLIAAQDIQ